MKRRFNAIYYIKYLSSKDGDPIFFNTLFNKNKKEVDKMEFKRDDFELVRSFEDKLFLGLRQDFFDDILDEVIEEVVEEVIEEEVPTEEEIAEIEKQKAIDDLKAALKELEKPEVEE